MVHGSWFISLFCILGTNPCFQNLGWHRHFIGHRRGPRVDDVYANGTPADLSKASGRRKWPGYCFLVFCCDFLMVQNRIGHSEKFMFCF